MHIKFEPELKSHTSVPLSSSNPLGDITPIAHEQGIKFVFYATISNDEYATLKEQGARIEVWSNLPVANRDSTHEWHAVAFNSPSDPSTSEASLSQNDILDLSDASSFASDASQDTNTTTVHATLTLSTQHLHDSKQTYQFTYRIVYPDNGIWWQGSGEDSNGAVLFYPNGPMFSAMEGDAEKWNITEDGAKCFSGSAAEVEETAVRLSKDVLWSGWVLTNDG